MAARRYRKIFASYSHKDLAIVDQFAGYAAALGDEYLRDWTHLRAGEIWNDRLKRLIDEADIFQLFWSRHSMVSEFVRQEWEYALDLAPTRPNFIRPTYWEEPMPCSVNPQLPPVTLARLHFQLLGTHQIDFEDNRWGHAGDANTSQAVVQPFDTTGNLHRYTLPDVPHAEHLFGEENEPGAVPADEKACQRVAAVDADDALAVPADEEDEAEEAVAAHEDESAVDLGQRIGKSTPA